MKMLIPILTLLMFLVLPATAGEPEPVRLPAIPADAKHPGGVNLKLMSEDPDYGYSDQKPIRVGSKEEYGGPDAEREYLRSLLDARGRPVTFKRLGSGGNDPEGHMLDLYEIRTSDGKKVLLWISMYHPKNDPAKQPAPVGFYKRK